ncbi:TPA: threonine--tRNA ligase [candidate division CPR2 bacterium]|uniref:Threonine--tRNA ligase n=1 Tax=candidate division CPR2 bacterium GW2011_GWC1_41_48 TaxID=1618344 RepID=A0A0G0W9L2_UNCC2|nr:MAG: Threonine-tRNA ligase [candidate division CPR2 bacterium GW2011_GWC2_39_35]KKR28250.1 MAG: Threonine-tRNA ligase [candidate division CPR2 bacterium GW2011_GWD2_39_7]KKS08747.1 MAG: Threonine-tRNA ligase [candidate division CPR2 bacterium GW2011_GWC1_41_48]OGB72422.1 MAG: threonine--tRNA ligase [candidate division CPR2 bacterium GWD2_39_7]HBG81216.1 threonine--tRNA ligase [candidate division CPR2 bacterium]
MSKEIKESKEIEIRRHSLAHILAYAVLEMFPDTKFGIGPAIENGFYYDFDLTRSLTPEDLKTITKRMQEIIKKDLPFEEFHRKISDAVALENKNDQPYKKELIEDLEKKGEKEVCFYKIGNFEDLCAGPHVESTGKVGAFKLMSVAGAYWKGSEKNPMLQRVYAVAFPTKEELENHLKMLEEAKKRDHRKLGKELELFVFSELVGPGLPLYTPRGTTVIKEMQKFSMEVRVKSGFQEVHTQVMNKAELFKTSGHYDKYEEDMFKVHSHYTKEEYFLKPMNCPQHTQIYASQIRSYKDLPYRVADHSMIYRDEKLGEVAGLTRVRGFIMDDGHSFCREDQIEIEFKTTLQGIREVLDIYGMDFYVRFSTRDPENKAGYLGDDKIWERAESTLEKILKDLDISYVIGIGDAAFYGPKMDIIAKDALEREHQISTIQLDFNMPNRFGLTYVGEDGKEYPPIMIHSALIGSVERFLGVLIEHYAGAFPTWLAPVQVKILTIADRHNDYAQIVAAKFAENSVRVEIDNRTETIGKKIREAEMQKNPYMLIVGDKEIEENKVAVRRYGKGDLGSKSVEELIKEIREEIRERRR